MCVCVCECSSQIDTQSVPRKDIRLFAKLPGPGPDSDSSHPLLACPRRFISWALIPCGLIHHFNLLQVVFICSSFRMRQQEAVRLSGSDGGGSIRGLGDCQPSAKTISLIYFHNLQIVNLLLVLPSCDEDKKAAKVLPAAFG